jgi:hypothetical protein
LSWGCGLSGRTPNKWEALSLTPSTAKKKKSVGKIKSKRSRLLNLVLSLRFSKKLFIPQLLPRRVSADLE